MFFNKKISFFILYCLLIFMVCSCTAGKNIKLAEQALNNKEWDKAVKIYLKLLDREPDNSRYKLSLSRAMISASKFHYKKADIFFKKGNNKLASIESDRALELNPENSQAFLLKQRILKKIEDIKKDLYKKSEIQQIKESVRDEYNREKLNYRKSPVSLQFKRISLKKIFDALSKISDINFIYDSSFKDRKVSVSIKNSTFDKVLNKLLVQNSLFKKVIDTNTVLLVKDTAAGRKKYEELFIKTFFISNGDIKTITKILKAQAGIKYINIDEKLKALTVKAPFAKVKLAERLISVYDKALGEVLINIEIIEVNKAKINKYGIDLSKYSVTQTFSPGVYDSETSSGSNAPVRLEQILNSDTSDYLFDLPSVVYNLMKTDSLSKIKAKPQVRVLDNEKVKISLGDKIPIPTTTFMSSYGSSSVNDRPVTSYKLEEIGINLEIEPHIHHNGWVSLKIDFSLTFITKPGTNYFPPTIGNRAVTTVVRLRDNETTVFAGLLRDVERKNMSGLPLISDIPVLRSIFSSTNNELDQTDIIMSVTPRIIRYPDIRKSDLQGIWGGTASKPELKSSPPLLKKTEHVSEESCKNSDKKERVKGSENKSSESKKSPEPEKEQKLIPGLSLESMTSEKGGLIRVTACFNKPVKQISTKWGFKDKDLKIKAEVKDGKIKKFRPLLFSAFNRKNSEFVFNIAFKEIVSPGTYIIGEWETDKNIKDISKIINLESLVVTKEGLAQKIPFLQKKSD